MSRRPPALGRAPPPKANRGAGECRWTTSSQRRPSSFSVEAKEAARGAAASLALHGGCCARVLSPCVGGHGSNTPASCALHAAPKRAGAPRDAASQHRRARPLRPAVIERCAALAGRLARPGDRASKNSAPAGRRLARELGQPVWWKPPRSFTERARRCRRRRPPARPSSRVSSRASMDPAPAPRPGRPGPSNSHTVSSTSSPSLEATLALGRVEGTRTRRGR